MLRRLRIRDFAIIDVLTVDFEPGLNVLTGETGAGKSIVVDALGLTLGERAQTDMIKSGKRETTVEAYFETQANPLLERLGIGAEDGVILRRIFSSAGKSRAYINDAMVNVQTLLEMGKGLVDIHGQHEHQSLLSAEQQREVVDAYGKLLDERADLERLFHEVRRAQAELDALREEIRYRQQRTDMLAFQIGEIESASLKPGETEALAEERAVLVNIARLKELTDSAYLLLHSGDGSSSEKLSSAVALLREVSKIDPGIGETLGLLESALPLVEDGALSLRSYRDRYDADPGRLSAVEERLELIKRLERKYGEGIEGILEQRDAAAKELERLALSDEKVKDLEGSLAVMEDELIEKARLISKKRKEAAKKIEKSVKEILREVAMDKAEFTIEVRPAALSSTGIDSVEFLFSANKGEQVKPLHKTASGGELSRVMLALKETLAEADRIPVLIFDEVDAGIGGRTAEAVGRRLKNLSRRHQVLCITHIPQIAAMADHHIMIEKEERRDGVCVRLKGLSSREREEEIARMLSGKVTDISIKHARELLKNRVVTQEGLV